MKPSKSKKKQAISVNQEELLFPDLEFLSPLCLKVLLLWKAEQLHDLALRISDLSSALNKCGDFPNDEESHRFYSKLSRSYKDKFIDFSLAACVKFKIITTDELETFILAGHTSININTLQKSFAFARGVLKIKINESYSLIMLAAACSAVSSVYRLNKDNMQENVLINFIAIEHRLTAKACEVIGYWTRRLEGNKNSQKGGIRPKMTIPIIMAIVEYLEEKPLRKQKTNYQIAESFKRNVREKLPIIVKYARCEWDVFFEEGKISAVPDTKHKAQQYQEIAFSTFMNYYIAEAKKVIKGESKYNQYITVPKNI